jgi:galactose mutarotase-like enzyme
MSITAHGFHAHATWLHAQASWIGQEAVFIKRLVTQRQSRFPGAFSMKQAYAVVSHALHFRAALPHIRRRIRPTSSIAL